MSYPESSLAKWMRRAPAKDEQLMDMRRKAWLEQGIAVIRPADIADDFARQAVINVANSLFGKRRG